MFKTKFFAAITAALFLFSFQNLDAQKIIANFGNNIPGESRIIKDGTDILSFEFGEEMPISTSGPRSAGRVTFKEVRFTKKMDKSSLKLVDALNKGAVLNQVNFKVLKSSSAAGTVVEYKFGTAKVVEYNVSVSDDGEIVEESFVLAVGQAKISYYNIDPKTGRSTKINEVSWDQTRNTPWR